MSIITISRGSYSYGKEIAEKAAKRLGYDCVSREILLKASEDFNIPEIKLKRAIHDAPTILNRLGYKKEKYIAYIKTALLRHLKKDNVVYHGMAGHFFVRDIPHVLKTRIVCDMQDRVRLEMKREGSDEKEAFRTLIADDEERRKWGEHLYGICTANSSLYDLVVHIGKICVDDAVDLICHTVGLAQFQTTPESWTAMEDLALAADIEAALLDVVPKVKVSVQSGIAHIETEAPLQAEQKLIEEIKQTVSTFSEVKDSRIDCHPIVPLSE